MRSIKKYYWLVCITLFCQCAADEFNVIENNIGELVFQLNGTLDGNPISFSGGLDDYYLFTETNLSEEDVVEMIGRFGKDEFCTTACDQSLEFVIRDSRVFDAAYQFDANQALPLGNYEYRPDSALPSTNYDYTLNLSTTIEGGIAPFNQSWQIDTITANNHFPSVNFDESETIFVCTNVSDATGKTANKCRRVNVSTHQNLVGNNDFHMIYDDNTNTMSMIAITSGSTFGLHNWVIYSDNQFGINVSNTNILTYQPNFLETFKVCLFSFDNQGNVVNTCKTIFPDSTGTFTNFDVDFDYEVESELEAAESTFFSNVAINYVDENGLLYSTKYGSQDGNNFEILERLPVSADIAGDEIAQEIIVQFDATLYNTEGDKKELKDFIGNIAVGVPE